METNSNKKWMLLLGAGLTLTVAAIGWSRHAQESDRVQAAGGAPQAVQQGNVVMSTDSPEAKAMVAQQEAAAKVIERQPDMKPIVGPVKERPPYVSQMEWAMLQGVAQQQSNPEKELTRMVNFLRYTKQMELWESLPKTPENASKRQVLATQLVDDLPTRVANGELDLKDAQSKLTAFLADALPDEGARRQRETDVLHQLDVALQTYKANEAANKPKSP
jgi:hypothetical protein